MPKTDYECTICESILKNDFSAIKRHRKSRRHNKCVIIVEAKRRAHESGEDLQEVYDALWSQYKACKGLTCSVCSVKYVLFFVLIIWDTHTILNSQILFQPLGFSRSTYEDKALMKMLLHWAELRASSMMVARRRPDSGASLGQRTSIVYRL